MRLEPISNAPGVTGSPAPIVQWHDRGQHPHVVQFYSSHEFLADSIAHFIADALRRGERGLVVATPAHAAAIEKRLLDSLGPQSALQSACLFLDAAQTLSELMLNDVPDAQRFQQVIGRIIERLANEAGTRNRVAVFGEMVALLWADGKAEAAVQLEELWNKLAEAHSFSLRCAYPIAGFGHDRDAEAFRQICDAHSGVIPVEEYGALQSDEERLRNVGYLQQRAQSLEKVKREREQAQTALRLREAELSDLLENTPEGIQRVGADQKISWANRALLELLGYPLGEYAGRNFAEFFCERDSFDECWRRLLLREPAADLACDLRCKDGSIKHVLVHCNGFWDGDELLYARCFIRDITEQNKAELALKDSEVRLRKAKDELEQMVEERTQALRRLSSQVLGLQDAERRRIARELHDSLGQYLAVLKLNIEMLHENPTQDELLIESAELTERCISEMRTLSYLLHPPTIDEAGLASAARWYIDGFGERSHTKVCLEADERLGRLPANVELALFRVLQEALTNVHRHAKASAVAVRIVRGHDRVLMEIRDDGRGIAPVVLRRFQESGAGPGVGLTGMRERVRELNGELSVNSNENGTILTVSVPVPAVLPDQATQAA